MSTATATSPVWRIEFDFYAKIKAAMVAAAFFCVFLYVLRDLSYEWMNSSDWSHGWIIPAFSGYLVYTRWDQVRRAPITHTWLGLVLMVAALGIYQYSLWGLVIGYLRPVAMLVCLLGICIYLCGLPMMRYAIVPWLYLFFAVP